MVTISLTSAISRCGVLSGARSCELYNGIKDSGRSVVSEVQLVHLRLRGLDHVIGGS